MFYQHLDIHERQLCYAYYILKNLQEDPFKIYLTLPKYLINCQAPTHLSHSSQLNSI